MSQLADVLEALAATIAARQGADPASSYTALLLSQGPERSAKKLGEEAIETVIAALSGDSDALASESADLIYHLLVVLQAGGVSLESVAEKLRAREGQSGLAEKAGRPQT